jgi:hypothetical protein
MYRSNGKKYAIVILIDFQLFVVGLQAPGRHMSITLGGDGVERQKNDHRTKTPLTRVCSPTCVALSRPKVSVCRLRVLVVNFKYSEDAFEMSGPAE